MWVLLHVIQRYMDVKVSGYNSFLLLPQEMAVSDYDMHEIVFGLRATEVDVWGLVRRQKGLHQCVETRRYDDREYFEAKSSDQYLSVNIHHTTTVITAVFQVVLA